MTRSALVLFAANVAACARPSSDVAPSGSPSASASSAPGGTEWLLAGSNDERFARVAKQLRGFDVAMVEVGYRYDALYWAGQDQNWGFATYQLEKIRAAIANGVERRPKRGASAKMIEAPLSAVEKAVAEKDQGAFTAAFGALTTVCNACHQAEGVAFVTIAIPTARVTPVRPLDGGS